MQQYLKYYSTRILGFFILLLSIIGVRAQPIVSSFSPNSGSVGSAVTITGNNFNIDRASDIVFFGAARAAVTSATTTSLTVVVPTGAAYQPISVVNVSTGLIGNSLQPFLTTFNNGNGQAITTTFFNKKTDFVTGTNPSGQVAIADIDGDGKLDMVVVDRSTNTFSILRNTSATGKTSFAAKVDFATDSTPSSIAIGDLDGDGKLDVVVTNLYPSTVSVFRNTSTMGNIVKTSFAAKINFISDTLSLPTAVAIADFDGDGKLDLAITNSFSNSISILKNISKVGAIDTSSFAPAIDFTTGLGPSAIAAADIDGDGKLDLVVANLNAKTISLFKNTATLGAIDTTSFAKKIDFSVGTGPTSIAIGDLNKDGKPDVIVANQGVNTISILTNTATVGVIAASSLAAKFDLPSKGASPYYVSVGNIDGSSNLDIIVANLITNNLAVIQNNYASGVLAATSFSAAISLATAFYPYSAAIADLDGDGKNDLVAPNYGSNSISVFQNAAISIMPVTFLNFAGKYESSGEALLAWKSATEVNTSYYIMLRSNDGTSYSEVGKVEAQGAGYQYTFSDILPLSNNASKVYYRLQAVDNNGMKTYSSIISLELNKSVSYAIFPNPAKGIINIKTNGIGGLVIITDLAGHSVYAGKMQETQIQQIPINTFAKGVYSVTIFTASGKQTKQLVVE